MSCESGSPFRTWIFVCVCSTVFSVGAVGAGVVGFCAEVRLIKMVTATATNSMSRDNLRTFAFSGDMRLQLLDKCVVFGKLSEDNSKDLVTPPTSTAW